MNTWLDFYRNNYYHLRNLQASGANRELIEGLYQCAAGFDPVMLFEKNTK
jgi:hypothetical protein